MADSNKLIGARIRELRERQGLTQAELAKALNVDRVTVGYWETGTRDLKTGYTIALADFFGVSCDEILRGIKPENLTTSKDLGLSEYSITCLKMLNDYYAKRLEDADIIRRYSKKRDADFLKFAIALDINADTSVFEQYNRMGALNAILEYEYKSDDTMVILAENVDDDEVDKKYGVDIQILSTIRDILNLRFIKDRQVIIDDSGDMNIISAEEAFYRSFTSFESYAFSAKSIIEARLFEKLKVQIIKLREIDSK